MLSFHEAFMRPPSFMVERAVLASRHAMPPTQAGSQLDTGRSLLVQGTQGAWPGGVLSPEGLLRTRRCAGQYGPALPRPDRSGSGTGRPAADATARYRWQETHR